MEDRKNKIQINTVLINSIAETDVLRRIETYIRITREKECLWPHDKRGIIYITTDVLQRVETYIRITREKECLWPHGKRGIMEP